MNTAVWTIPEGKALTLVPYFGPRKQANLVNSDIDPVIGKKPGSDGLHRVFMAGDREKDDPLSVQCKGVGERVKSVGLDGDQSWKDWFVPGRVVCLTAGAHSFVFLMSHSSR